MISRFVASNNSINIKYGDITVGGRIKVMKWCILKGNFTTFYVFGNHGANAANFSLDIERNLKVKGFMANNNKNLKFLPVDVSENFPNLLAYSASRCCLRGLVRSNFEGLMSLQHLDLQHNKIESIESKNLHDLKSLKYLKLSFNKINHISNDSFESLVKLEELHLQNNQIQFISFHIDPFFKLKIFDASENKLVSFPNYFFKNNKKLTNILLKNNQLNSIPHKIFNDISSLNLVDFKGNSCIQDEYFEENFDAMKEKLMNDC